MGENNKIVTISEAAASIPDGAHIALGGFTIARNPIAMVHELIRQNKRDLTVSQYIGAMDAELLIGAGAVKKYYYAGGTLDRFGPLYNTDRAIETGSIDVSEYSGLSMAMKYLGGSLGLPCIPIQSLLGSDMLGELLKKEEAEAQLSSCPFTGEKMVMLKTLMPDVAIVHVPRCDCEGNALITGPRWEEDAAKAADKIIVVADEIIDTEMTPFLVEQVRIPACRVSMVVHQPYGAHPTSVYGVYDYDYDHLKLFISQAKTEQGMQEYLDRYVRGTSDFWEYLDMVGGLEKMSRIKADLLKNY